MKTISCILLVCPLSLMGYVEETQEEQVERLIGELQDQNEDVRMGAARALGQIGTPEAIKAAVPVLNYCRTRIQMFVWVRQGH